jgi:hypothetical protein
MPRIRTCNRLTAVVRPQPPQGRVPAFIASAFVKPRAGMSDAEATRAMANDMLNAAYGEGITENDLEAMGYTRAQVKTLAPAARQRAHSLAGATA